MKEASKHTLIDLTKIYYLHVKLITKANFQYRLNSLMIALAVFCRESISIIAIYLIFSRFSTLNSWNMRELFFLYSFLFLSYSLVALFFTGIRDFETMVYEGELDRLMTRPLGLLYQVIAGKADYAATIGHGLIGIMLFCASAYSVQIEWTLTKIVYLITVIIGGVLIQASFFMIASSFSFWTIKTTNIKNLLFFNMRRFSAYPLSIYPFFLRILLIYVIPFAFVNYFPAQFFLKKNDAMIIGGIYQHLTLVVGIIMFLLSHLLWKQGVKRYTSVGN